MLTGGMATACDAPAAVLLRDGEVLVTCGATDGSVELYDPASGAFKQTGALTTIRTTGATATLLQTGQVLVVGGNDRTMFQPLASAELYDPSSGTFTATGSMHSARSGHVAALLADGRILILGGSDAEGAPLASAELYDPTSGEFARTGSMHYARADAAATVLKDGRVLVVGGSGASGIADKAPSTAEVYDPATGEFVLTGSPKGARHSGHTATLLGDGRVLVAGGNASDTQELPLETAEVYDPSSGEFTATGAMAVARDGLSATALGSGRVLVVGGADESAELYDPSTGKFAATGSAAVVRSFQAATLLGDGRVLLLGGAADPGQANSAETYRP
jgi:WD40 repeat protein